MSAKAQLLAIGQVLPQKHPIYNVTYPSIKAVLRHFTISNTHTAPVVVNLWVDANAGETRPAPKDLVLDPGDTSFVVDDGAELCLNRGNGILAQASVANAIDFVISGDVYDDDDDDQ